jgi:hypothetical protein
MNLKKVCFVGLCSLAFTSLADNVWNVGTYEKRRGWPIVSEDGTKKLYIKCAPQTDYTSGIITIDSLGADVSGVIDLRDIKLKSSKGLVDVKSVSIGKDILRKNASVTGFYANKVSSVGHCAFSRAEKLERVILSGSADTIPNGSYATHPGIRSGVFSDCPALKEVELDLPLKHLGDAAFAGSTNLSSDITKIVPRTIESIGTTAFWNCINLRGELVTDAVKSVGSRAFQRAGFDSISLGCDGSLKEFASGGSSGGISYGVFTGGPNLTNLEVRAAGLVSLGSNNFSDIPNLKRAAFDAPKLEVMGETRGCCSGLKSLEIIEMNTPRLRVIGESWPPFNATRSLKEVVWTGPAPRLGPFKRLFNGVRPVANTAENISAAPNLSLNKNDGSNTPNLSLNKNDSSNS